jgi:glyoxylase-like metal-dependent hydrolase (beta-lactamase superfamily II)
MSYSVLIIEDEPVLARGREMVQMWMGYDPGPMPSVDGHVLPGDVVRFGQEELEVRLAPGHSPGSLVYVHHASKQVWGGDVLFAGGVGRFDFLLGVQINEDAPAMIAVNRLDYHR